MVRLRGLCPAAMLASPINLCCRYWCGTYCRPQHSSYKPHLNPVPFRSPDPEVELRPAGGVRRRGVLRACREGRHPHLLRERRGRAPPLRLHRRGPVQVRTLALTLTLNRRTAAPPQLRHIAVPCQAPAPPHVAYPVRQIPLCHLRIPICHARPLRPYPEQIGLSAHCALLCVPVIRQQAPWYEMVVILMTFEHVRPASSQG